MQVQFSKYRIYVIELYFHNANVAYVRRGRLAASNLSGGTKLKTIITAMELFTGSAE